jgi:hypothetical protein
MKGIDSKMMYYLNFILLVVVFIAWSPVGQSLMGCPNPEPVLIRTWIQIGSGYNYASGEQILNLAPDPERSLWATKKGRIEEAECFEKL